MDAGKSGLGIYTLEINVIAESGGGIGCTNTDNGEEVEYLVELITLDYSINSLWFWSIKLTVELNQLLG